jgi:hypothetical protein
MEKVKVEDAVGMVLAHDLTKIVPGEYKGPAFKKGHVVRAGDIAELKNMGKDHLYVVALNEDRIHENDAASRVALAAAGYGTGVAEPSEGKANITAAIRGLLQIDRPAQNELNRFGNLALVSLHNQTLVNPGQIIAAAKIIPLTMERSAVEQAEAICGKTMVVGVKPFLPLKTGVIITGSEVYYGRIRDKFGAVFEAKIRHYGGQLLEIAYAPDDPDFISGLIEALIAKGAEIVLISGGMAVDADDVTPQAIAGTATEVITYGAPLLPGAMCMIAYQGPTALVGVPACAMYHEVTVLDLVLPRILTGERLNREAILKLAHGGLCLRCEVCHYPACSFGK